MNIPNILTTIRFILIGVFVFVFFDKEIEHNTIWAFVVFVIAGITDALDGFLARHYNQITKWGKLMDPLADKLMIITVLTCLYIAGTIPMWVIIVMALKELLMIIGAALLYKDGVVVQANIYGKVATVLFYLAITLIVFDLSYSMHVLTIAVISTILALIQYTIKGFNAKKVDNSKNLDIIK